MIDYSMIGKFDLQNQEPLRSWITFVLDQENKELGEINYIFCDDDYLLDFNVKILNHSTLTDIISLDYTLGYVVSGDIYISYERVMDNSEMLGVSFIDELHRVMIHGVLHYCGYSDKSDEEKKVMRSKEDYYLSLRTF